MKKWMKFFVIFLSLAVVVACGRNGDDVDDIIDNEAVSAAFDAIELGDISGLNNLDLPQEVGGFKLAWQTSDTQRIDLLGNVFRPLSGESAEEVILTAIIEDDNVTYEREFSFTLSPLSADESQAMSTMNQLANDIDLTIRSSRIDLLDEVNGVAVQWMSSNPFTIRPDGEVIPPLFANRNDAVILTAQVEVNGQVREMRFSVLPMALGEASIDRTRTVDFFSIATEYIVEDAEIDLYYLSNQNLPYVSMIDFINLLEGAIKIEELTITEDGSFVTLFYDSEDEDDPSIVYEYEMTIDFATNIVTVNRFGFFTGLSEATQTDFGVGLEVVDYEETLYDSVVMNLSDYRFDLLYDDDHFYMPLVIANLFFSGSMYDVYYNGDAVIGFDTYQIISSGSDGRSARRILNDTSYNSLNMPRDIKDATYRYLAFSFDFFYGLKGVQEVETYFDVFSDNKPNIFTQTGLDATHYREMVHIANSMDDLHTWHQMSGIYGSLLDYRTQQGYGPRINAYIRALNQVSCNFSEGVTYYDNDRLARIFIDGFSEDTPVDFETWMEEIDAKGSVERVIIDLSCNGGGILGTMIQVLGYMTDDLIPIHGMNATALSTSTVWYSSENVARDYEWFILTSPLTYSAANLMTSIAQDMGIATVIGQKSSGGASSITTNILPNGTILMMSSTSVLTDETYESIEFGIEVDIEIDFEDFNNEDALIDATK